MRAPRILTMLAERSPVGFDLAPLSGPDCEGSRHHSPTPLLVRPYDLATPGPLGGLTDGPGTDTVYLCATCADNLTVYLVMLAAYSGAPYDAVRRNFGNIIRELGDRAWGQRQQHAPVGP